MGGRKRSRDPRCRLSLLVILSGRQPSRMANCILSNNRARHLSSPLLLRGLWALIVRAARELGQNLQSLVAAQHHSAAGGFSPLLDAYLVPSSPNPLFISAKLPASRSLTHQEEKHEAHASQPCSAEKYEAARMALRTVGLKSFLKQFLGDSAREQQERGALQHPRHRGWIWGRGGISSPAE